MKQPNQVYLVRYKLITHPFNQQRCRVVVQAAQGSRSLTVGELRFGPQVTAFQALAEPLRSPNANLTIKQRYDILKPLYLQALQAV
jgi:hypothetical protein